MSERMEDQNSSWRLVNYYFQSEYHLVLQVDMGRSNLMNITVQFANSSDPAPDWKLNLFEFFINHCPPSHHQSQITIEDILQQCRQMYNFNGPLLGNSLHLEDEYGRPIVVESMDPELESQLRTASELFSTDLQLPQLVCRDDLQHIVTENGSFTVDTKPVQHEGEFWVAKGPSTAGKFAESVKEASILFNMQTHHPNIMPPPSAIVTLAPNDERVCGYLFPLYENGNLNLFALRARHSDPNFQRTLLSWFTQLTSAVKCLMEQGLFHGDIKPDNILVSSSQQVILSDITQGSTTVSITSPEVQKVSMKTRQVRIPKTWSSQAIEKSEVYSLGRTMYLISEGIPMLDVYLRKGPEGGEYPTSFSTGCATSLQLQQIILACTDTDPQNRPNLVALEQRLAAAEMELAENASADTRSTEV